jgi:hypothetical protein
MKEKKYGSQSDKRLLVLQNHDFMKRNPLQAVSSTTITSRHRYRRQHGQDDGPEFVDRVPGLLAEGIDFLPIGSVSALNFPLRVVGNFTHWLCPLSASRRLNKSCSCSG